MGVLTCYLIYLLGRKMDGELVGLIAAGLFAIYPLFVFFSGVLMAETLLILLTTMSFVSCIQFWQKSTVAMAMIFGGIVGLSALCKPILLPWLPPVLFFLVAKIAPDTCTKSIACTNFNRRTLPDYLCRGQHAITSSRANLFPSRPIWGSTCSWAHTPRGAAFTTITSIIYRFITHSPTHLWAQKPTAASQSTVLGWIIAQPLHYLSLSIDKLLYFWCPWVPGEPPLYNAIAALSCTPLLILGLIGTLSQRHKPEGLALIILIICMSLLHMVFFAHTRFRLPLDAILCVPAAWVCVQWINRIRRRT